MANNPSLYYYFELVINFSGNVNFSFERVRLKSHYRLRVGYTLIELEQESQDSNWKKIKTTTCLLLIFINARQCHKKLTPFISFNFYNL